MQLRLGTRHCFKFIYAKFNFTTLANIAFDFRLKNATLH